MGLKMKTKLMVFLASLLCFNVYATECDQFFPNGKEIVIPGTTALCNSFFVVLFDTTHEAPMVSAEITQPKDQRTNRTNDFHGDSRLKNDSPLPSDYDNSGFDRGHMTPAADASTPKQMSETFLMTNMTPQAPKLNRTAWRLMEEKVRGMDSKYIVTGAVYKYPAKTIGKHNIPVPASYYKVVYLKDGSKVAFNAINLNEADVTEISFKDLQEMLEYKLPD
jgi:endonuclease G